jgi:hypothetical protein
VAQSEVIRNHAAFTWSVADLLRGDCKQSEYGRVILPMVVLRRLDCVLEPAKDKVLAKYQNLEGKVANVEPVLREVAGEQFYNTSPLTMTRLLDDPPHIADNLRGYVLGFSSAARDVLEKFDLSTYIDRLERPIALPGRATQASEQRRPGHRVGFAECLAFVECLLHRLRVDLRRVLHGRRQAATEVTTPRRGRVAERGQVDVIEDHEVGVEPPQPRRVGVRGPENQQFG